MGAQVAQQGLTWGVLGESITPDYPFSARNVFIVVAADILMYALLTAYLDQVRPGPPPAAVPYLMPHMRSDGQCWLQAFHKGIFLGFLSLGTFGWKIFLATDELITQVQTGLSEPLSPVLRHSTGTENDCASFFELHNYIGKKQWLWMICADVR